MASSAAKVEYARLYNTAADGDSDLVEEPMIPRRMAVRRFTQNTRTILLLVYSALTTTLLAVVAIQALSTSQSLCSENECIKTNMTRTKLGRDTRYMSLDAEYDDLWKDVVGNMDDAIIFNLTDPRIPIGARGATISMFHQLHCLTMFRVALQEAQEGILPGSGQAIDGHWPHCFDYLRRSILCAADATLERQPMFANGTIADFVGGSQDKRYCGDSGALIKQMESYNKTVLLKPFP